MNDAVVMPAESAPLSERTLTPWQRTIALFARPTQAWVGLAKRTQWWIPFLVTLVVQFASIGILYERASMPDAQARMDRMVDSGMLSQEQADRSMERSGGWTGIVTGWIAIAVFSGLGLLLMPSILSFGISFLLGAKLRFREALGVICWAGLIRIPEQVLVTALAWYQETVEGTHVGWAAFLSTPDEPTKGFKLMAGALDSVGPFALWYLVVIAIGASALSGAGRKPAIAVVIGLYALIVAFFLGLAALLPFPM